jgi:hypothetical protein
VAYLLRLVLPDRPGSLGAVATALGHVGGDILSLDVVERGPDGAVDDLVVDLPNSMPDTLLTAAQSVEGVVVESLRPYQAGQDLHRDLELVDELAADPDRGIDMLVHHAAGVFRAGWALLLVQDVGGVHVEVASAGAPDAEDVTWGCLPLTHARRVASDEPWVPTRWEEMGIELAIAPVGSPDRAVLVGRPGGPRFRASEVLRLAHLAGIASTVSRPISSPTGS